LIQFADDYHAGRAKDDSDYRNRLGLTGFLIATAAAIPAQIVNCIDEETAQNISESLRANVDIEFINWVKDHPEEVGRRVEEWIGTLETLGDALPLLLPTITFYNTLRKGGSIEDAFINTSQCALYAFVGHKIAAMVATTDYAQQSAFTFITSESLQATLQQLVQSDWSPEFLIADSYCCFLWEVITLIPGLVIDCVSSSLHCLFDLCL
jgi:hypothetical protein